MTKPIAIFGAGGLGREILALVRAIPEWKMIGFFDDGIKKGEKIGLFEVLGGRDELNLWHEEIHLIIALGDPKSKKEIAEFLQGAKHISYPTLIHPQAVVMDYNCSIGDGSVLTAGCIITTNVKIGEHVLINLNATIGHDAVIENYASIMPGANIAGAVTIGESVLIGSGANILSDVKIGEAAIIGSGAVVNHSVQDHMIAVGIPARSIKKNL